jgi:hypothetical protein
MLGMDVGDVALAGYITVLWGGFGALLWNRLNRIESKIAEMSDKADLELLRQAITGLPDKAQIEANCESTSEKQKSGDSGGDSGPFSSRQLI